MNEATREVFETATGGRYAIEGFLARGGMGTVYTARVRSLGSKVALKILPPEVATSDSRVARFKREAAVAANLSHPNIVPVFEFDASSGLVYLVMPFVEGQTLAGQLAERKRLEYPAVRKLIGDVGGALDFAHRNHVIHRDIKPSNLIEEEATGRWLVTDFGIAHSTRPDDSDITQTGVVLGTPAYMPPEQALGSGVDHRSDLYSLAAVAFQALCGIPIDSLADYLVKGSTEIERTIRSAVPQLKPALAAALASPLSPLQEERPESVAAWLEAIEEAEGTKSLYRWAAAARRRVSMRLLAALGVVAAVTVVALTEWPFGPEPEGAQLDLRRIAVLYFDDHSEGQRFTYVAAGLTEGLIHELSRVDVLEVISPNGVKPYRDADIAIDSIVRRLKVGTIVGGSTVRSADRLRVTVQLVDAASLTQVWSRTLERPWGELFALQDELTQEVSRFLRERLGEEIRLRESRVGTQSVEAWELVQHAAQLTDDFERFVSLGDMEEATNVLEQADSLLARATSLDPAWTEALVQRGWLARWRAEMAGYGRTGDPRRTSRGLRESLAHAERALSLKPDDPAALELRGYHYRWHALFEPADRDSIFDLAERDLRAAVAVDPSRESAWNRLSDLLQVRQRLSEADLAAKRALEEDPFLAERDEILWRLFYVSLELGRETDASGWCEEIHRRHPAPGPSPEHEAYVTCSLLLLAASDTLAADVDRAWRLVTEYLDHLSVQDEYVAQLKLEWEIVVAAVLARAGLADSARATLYRAHDAYRESQQDSSVTLSLRELYFGMLAGDTLLPRWAPMASPADTVFLVTSLWGRALLRDPRFREAAGIRN